MGKVTYSLLPGPEHCGIVSTAHDGPARNSHVKIPVSHTGGHTSAEGQLDSLPSPGTREIKSRGALQKIQDHVHVKRESHPVVTGMEEANPPKYIRCLGKPPQVWEQ